MHKTTCPYGCGWAERYALERLSEKARETHMARCPKRTRRRTAADVQL
jgi:hypothetical protein